MATSRDDLLYRKTIDAATFRLMADTFDDAWATVEEDFAGAPDQEIDAVRSALAKSIVQVAREGYTDAAVIRRAALGALGTFARPSDASKMN